MAYASPILGGLPAVAYLTPGKRLRTACFGTGVICETWALEAAVIPAKAGIYSEDLRKYIVEGLDSRFRGIDRRFETDPMPNDTTTHVLPAPAQAHGLGGTRVCDCPPMHFDAINVKLLRSKICGLSESHEVRKRAVGGNIRRV